MTPSPLNGSIRPGRRSRTRDRGLLGWLALLGSAACASCASPPPIPDGQYLYVLHQTDARSGPPVITAFRIQDQTGELLSALDRRQAVPTPVPAAETKAAGAELLDCDPVGRWFTASGGDSFAVLHVTDSGALAASPTSLRYAWAIAFHPSGRWVFQGGSGRGVPR